MREALLIESVLGGGVRILARSDDPELVERLARELAALERRRLARLESPVRLPNQRNAR
jgi:hypothetical protein